MIVTAMFYLYGFQSHLYGIESYDESTGKHYLVSFNRTFMELKDECSRHSKTTSAFQSHLYGIES